MKYDTLADEKVVKKVIEALGKRNVEAEVVENGSLALAKIKEFIPEGASVMNGASVTLEQIGFVDYLKEGKHGWNNVHEAIIAEKDPDRQASLRKQAVLSDYYFQVIFCFLRYEFLIRHYRVLERVRTRAIPCFRYAFDRKGKDLLGVLDIPP